MKNRLFMVFQGFLLIFFLISNICYGENAPSKWWDKLGEPKYGGSATTTARSLSNVIFDNYNFIGGGMQWWFETLWAKDWTLDRKIWSFNTPFSPEKYYTGLLAKSWELPDAQTIIVHLREDVHYQNKPPVNGRQFTAYDVEKHYDRMLGTGSGFTEPSPYYKGFTSNWERVTAKDKYTVVYKFKKPTGTGFLTALDAFGLNTFDAPEWVALGEKGRSDWHNAVGTGPFMLTDLVTGTSMTFSRNPDYYGHDERHPDSRLPYLDQLKVIVIPDPSTSLAALRTKKIDILEMLSWQQARTMKQSNPELIQAKTPGGSVGIDIRCDVKPFSDINVRKALQMAINRKAIASGYYAGTVDDKPAGLVNPALKGYCFEYKDWPQELKDEYSYNPERAKKLLAEAGYPNGFKTNVVATSDDNMPLIELFKDQFKDIGVDMEIKPMEYGAWRSYVLAKKHDQLVSGGGAMPFPPHMVISFRDSRDAANNRTFNNDPGYDAIVDKFNAATSPEEVAKYMVAADRYALEKHWSVYAVPTYSYSIWQPYLKGYSGESTGPMGGAHLWARVWVDGK